MKSKLKIPRKLSLNNFKVTKRNHKIKEFILDEKNGKRVTIHMRGKSCNSATLASFALYCQQNPNERFWQALRNWGEQGYIYASNKMSPDRLGHFKDTFYWESRRA